VSVLLAYQLMKRVLEEVNEDSDKLRHDPVCRDLEMDAHTLLIRVYCPCWTVTKSLATQSAASSAASCGLHCSPPVRAQSVVLGATVS